MLGAIRAIRGSILSGRLRRRAYCGPSDFLDLRIGIDARGGEKLLGFEIAGKSGDYVSADARIDGPTVVVSCDQMPDPARVRYAWADDPKATLENHEGLQASPFRADLK